MKTWRRPEAVGQEFAANEYVSACTVTVSCNFWPSNIEVDSNQLRIPDTIEGFQGHVYEPCGIGYDENSYVVHVSELNPVTFSKTAYVFGDEPFTPQTAYYWTDVKADGSTDFHATAVTPELTAAIENGKS